VLGKRKKSESYRERRLKTHMKGVRALVPEEFLAENEVVMVNVVGDGRRHQLLLLVLLFLIHLGRCEVWKKNRFSSFLPCLVELLSRTESSFILTVSFAFTKASFILTVHFIRRTLRLDGTFRLGIRRVINRCMKDWRDA